MIQEESSIERGPSVSEPDRIMEIRTNIRAGEEWLKTGNYTQSNARWDFWKRNSEWLRCDWHGEKGEDKTDFHVNIPYMNHRTVKPTLMWKVPHVSVEAKQPDFVRDPVTNEPVMDEGGMPQLTSDNHVNARLMEIKLNHEIEQIKLKEIMRRCVSHAKGHYGIGWAKTGYQNLSVAQFNNDRDSRTNYWVEWVDPRDVPFDWRAVEAKQMRWVAQRLIMPRREVEAAGFRLPPNYVGRLPEHILDRDRQTGATSALSYKDSPLEFMEFWEYHDLEQNMIDWCLTDGPGQEYFYMRDTSVQPYPHEGSSFVPLVINEDDHDLIGVTDIQPVEEQVKALNRMRTREVHHMDNYGTGMIAEETAVTDAQRKKYRRTPYGYELIVRDGALNRVKLQGTPSMGSDHYNMSQAHKEEIRTILGISDYQQGGADLSRKATEAEIIRSAGSIRIEDDRTFVGDFAVEIVRRIAAMVQAFAQPIEFYNVAREEFDDDFIDVLKQELGYNPKLPFLGIPKERIQGEFDFKINIEEMVHQPREVRAAQLQKSLSLVIQDPEYRAKFEQKYDVDKIFAEVFELNGVQLKKFEKGGPIQIPAILENEMFKKGMEVPDPHAKDDASEHQIAHGPLRRELENRMAELQGKAQKLQAGVRMIPEMMGGSPQGQTVMETAQAQIEQIMQQLDQTEAILRRVKLHVQAHASKEAEKEAGSGMGGGGGLVGAPTGQPAQPPDAAQILRMSRQGRPM